MKEIIAQMKRDHILDVAEEIFYKEGFKKAQLSIIAKEAGVSMATIYGFFTNKEGLFAAYIERIIERTYHEVVTLLEPIKDPKERLKAIVKHKFNAINQYPKAYLQEIIESHPMFTVAFGRFGNEQAMQKLYVLIAEVFESIHTSTPLREEDFAKMAILFKAFTNGYIECWVYGNISLDDVADEAVEMFLKGALL